MGIAAFLLTQNTARALLRLGSYRQEDIVRTQIRSFWAQRKTTSLALEGLEYIAFGEGTQHAGDTGLGNAYGMGDITTKNRYTHPLLGKKQQTAKGTFGIFTQHGWWLL
jgi:hypothetical protein